MTGAKRKKKSMLWSKMHTPQCEDIIQWCRRRLPILDWAPHYNLKENLLPDTVSGIMLAVQQVTQAFLLEEVVDRRGLRISALQLELRLWHCAWRWLDRIKTLTKRLSSLQILVGKPEPMEDSEKMHLADKRRLAFAVLSSVHPVFGLYGSLFPAIIYAIFGMGHHVATGTFALTSLISANAVERIVPQNMQNLTTQSNTSVLGLSDFEMQRIHVAAAVSFLGGVIQVAMFVLQLGSATFVVTEPVISAMTTGAATHVVTSQVKYLLGMKMPYISGPLGFFYIYAYVFENIKSVRLEALLLSLLSIVVLVLVKELNEQFKRKIKVVLPVDLVLEFLAHGLSNIVSSFFFCIPSAAAMGRTAGLYSTGAKTQVACLISCIFVLIVIYAIGPLLYWLPMCVLASIIVVGLKGMLIQFRDLKKYWNVDKIDWGIWVSTYVFTICFAANVGLLFGVVCTIAIVIGRFPRAMTVSIKNMKEMEFKAKTEMDSETLQQVKIISINNPLVFLNAKKFYTDLMNIIQKENACNQPLDDISKCEQNTLLNSLSNGNCNEEASQSCPNEKCSLILDCSGFTFFDSSGVSMLVEVYMDCKGRSVDVLLAHCTASLIKAMTYYGNLDSEKPIFFESVSAAISHIHSNKASYKLLFDNLDLPTMPPL
ncbi:anion exchange transporter isoform X5 [Pan troglodytes]|uniref:anion exchange transporter isoform X5 n=1 Tax=Pan troglodytes TaxID=9598 RepID=UPI0007DBA8DC|nr:anion exchange transporter isoform X5 [Pan troglodytes]